MRVPPPGLLRAAVLMSSASLLFAAMNATAKALGPGYSPVQLLFFRNLFAVMPLFLALPHGERLARLRTRNPLGHALRALAGIASLAAFFYAYARVPLATVVAISFAAPVFVAALSWPLLGERVGPRRSLAILVGFAGVLVVLRPSAAGLGPDVLVAVAATVLYALVMISMRHLNRSETPVAIVFYYLATSVVVSGLALPFVWTTPDLRGWLLLLALGLFGGIGQIAMTTAFRHADASLVAPFDYLSILWASAIGWMLWREWPSGDLWLGVAIVMASGLYIGYREAVLRRR